MSPYFLDAMHSLKDAPGVIDIRSFGMMAGVEVAAVGNAGARGNELQKKLYDIGLHLKSTGETLIVAPAFVAEKKHIDDITNKIRGVLKA